MIEYLLSITVAPFKNEKQQQKELSKLVGAIENLNYVGHVHLFCFKEGINKHNPKYYVPKRKNLPKIFEKP